MSTIRDLLEQLPPPEHGPDFWTRLEIELADRTTPLTHTGTIDQDTGIDLDIDPGRHTHGIETEDELRRRQRRRVVMAIVAVAAAIVAFVLGITALSEDTGPAPVVTDRSTTVAPTTAPATTVPTTTAANVTTTLDGTPPQGGLVSAGLPIQVSQQTELLGEEIVVTGSGHPADRQVGVVQCYSPIGQGEADPDLGLCDLSNFVIATTAADGSFTAPFTPRRFVATSGGSFDCARRDGDLRCGIAAGLLTDTTAFGIIEITFDPGSSGAAARSITATPATGLHDGDEIMVSGEGFEPAETLVVSTCVLGSEIRFCPARSGGPKVVTDQDGSFTIQIEVAQSIGAGLGNCSTWDEFGCWLAAVGDGTAHPIRLEFDGEPSAGEEAREAEVLSAGEEVRFELPLTGATDGETFTARQCQYLINSSTFGEEVDPGTPPICGEPVTGVVSSGNATFDIIVADELHEGSTTVDCRMPLFPVSIATCQIRVETASYLHPAIEIHMDVFRNAD